MYLLAAAILIPFSTASSANASSIDLVRVGLAYSEGALAGGNLLNSEGAGYRFGYMDGDNNFTQLGYTYETAISVVKTQNVWYGPVEDGRNGYTDTETDGAAVGCYHLQYPYTYASFDEALVFAQSVDGFVAWIDEAYYVRTGAYLSSETARSNATSNTTVVGTSAGGMSVVETGTNHILFQFDTGSTTGILTIKPNLDESTKAITWFAGRKYYGDFSYQRLGSGNLTVVNVLPREDYVNCVISQEMSDNWPMEALKAQAVAARSYSMVCGAKHYALGFDVCSTTCCQAYPGMSLIGENTTQATQETAGVYAWYNGEIAQTYYFSSDGGATENSENIWIETIPYLRGVTDLWESTVSNDIPNYNYSISYTKEELEQKLQEDNKSCTNLESIILTSTEMGNVKSIKFVDANGNNWTYYGDNARIFLSTRSVRFSLEGGGSDGYYVNGSGDSISSVTGAWVIGGDGTLSQVPDNVFVITGNGVEQLASTNDGVSGDVYTFSGTGYGHNLGMSQWGANAMAQAGKTYEEILKFYFTGIEIY